jgi:hypothetical protein
MGKSERIKMSEEKVIYIRQIGNSWTLCNKYGHSVDWDGEFTYHPYFYNEKPEGYPLYEKEKEKCTL